MKNKINIVLALAFYTSMVLFSCSPKIETGYAQINGTSIFYELKGSGTTLVFLHGMALDMRFWDNQFDELSDDYRLLRYDFRGFGRSDVPDTTSYSHHEDLRALLEYLDIDEVVLIGHSMGGYPAFRFAYDFPDRVKALVLAEGHPNISRIHDNPESREVGNMFANVAKIGKNEGIEKGKEALLGISVSKSAIDNPLSNNLFIQMVDDYSGWHWQNKDPQIWPQRVNIEELAELKIPVLLINGELSHKSYHLSLKAIHTQLPDSKHIVLEDSGHMLSLENPVQFNKELKIFLDEHQIK